MCVCVCVCLCVCVFERVCVHVCLCVSLHMRVHALIRYVLYVLANIKNEVHVQTFKGWNVGQLLKKITRLPTPV